MTEEVHAPAIAKPTLRKFVEDTIKLMVMSLSIGVGAGVAQYFTWLALSDGIAIENCEGETNGNGDGESEGVG